VKKNKTLAYQPILDRGNIRYKGRPATVPYGEIARLFAEGLGAGAIARKLRISRASVYRGRPDEITDTRLAGLAAEGVDFGVEMEGA
jgi:DNA invertase Pin-like site-specific DNA recombinase